MCHAVVPGCNCVLARLASWRSVRHARYTPVGSVVHVQIVGDDVSRDVAGRSTSDQPYVGVVQDATSKVVGRCFCPSLTYCIRQLLHPRRLCSNSLAADCPCVQDSASRADRGLRTRRCVGAAPSWNKVFACRNTKSFNSVRHVPISPRTTTRL